MPASERSGASSAVTQLLAAAAAVIGGAGYVYLLGAAVLWTRLEQAHLPTDVPVSLAFRPELVVMGAETLAIWATLGIVIGLMLWAGMRARSTEIWPTLAGAVAGAALGVLLWSAAVLGSRVPILLALLPVALPVVAGAAAPAPLDMVRAAAIPAAAAGAAAAGTCELVHTERAFEAGLAWVTFAALLVAALLLRPGYRSRKLTLEALATQEELRDRLAEHAVRYGEADPTRATLLGESSSADARARTLRTKLRAPVDPGQRAVWQWWQWSVLAVAGLLVLGAIALVHEAGGENGFETAFVALDNKRCVSGSYIAGDAKQLLLGAKRWDYSVGRYRRRVVLIPETSVHELQIRPPRAPTADISVVHPCTGEVVQKLAADRPAAGGGKPGKPGPRGRPGRPGRVIVRIEHDDDH
jgi:hypothetical protein